MTSSRACSSLRCLTAFALAATLATAAGCASPAVRAAESGDRERLAAILAARQRDGALGNDEAARIARAVAKRDLEVARGAEARARVAEARVCAAELDDALASRATKKDAAAADAARARLDAGEGSLADAREHKAATDDAFRALGARGLVGRRFERDRHRALLDPSPDVRRAALSATASDVSDSDVPALLDVARLDPEPLARSEAVRALAGAPVAAAPRIVTALVDLWPAADGPLREDIASQWARPPLYTAGGRDALRHVLAADRSSEATFAAAAALRAPAAPGDDVPDLARARLARALESGTRKERLRVLPMAPAGLARPYLATAAEDDDPAVASLALARLVQDGGAPADAARTKLFRLASVKGPSGQSARLALAGLGERRVQAWLEEDLGAGGSETRVRAAQGLATLGRAMRAAPLLIDADASVRLRAACIIVLGARRRP